MSSRDEWGDCPPGTLSAMVTDRKRRQRRAVTDRLVRASAACLLFVAAMTAFSILLTRGPANATEMTCSRAAELFPDYHGGELSPELHQQVQAHLTKCPHCQEAYRRGYEQETSDADYGGSSLVLGAFLLQ